MAAGESYKTLSPCLGAPVDNLVTFFNSAFSVKFLNVGQFRKGNDQAKAKVNKPDEGSHQIILSTQISLNMKSTFYYNGLASLRQVVQAVLYKKSPKKTS
jgi:hypothetical protein